LGLGVHYLSNCPNPPMAPRHRRPPVPRPATAQLHQPLGALQLPEALRLDVHRNRHGGIVGIKMDWLWKFVEYDWWTC
jgi:hypothetical protein